MLIESCIPVFFGFTSSGGGGLAACPPLGRLRRQPRISRGKRSTAPLTREPSPTWVQKSDAHPSIEYSVLQGLKPKNTPHHGLKNRGLRRAKALSCQVERVQICQSQRLCTLRSNYAPRARNRPNDRPLSQGFTRRDSIASLSQSIPMPGVDGATAFPSLTSISDRVTMRSCGMYST